MLEAGPFWDPDRDWVSDEAGSHKLYWTENRLIGGEDPVELGKNNSGHGVGGSMIHYAGYCAALSSLRLPDREPRRRRRGLADLPTSDLKAALRAPRARAAGRGRALAVGRPARLPARAPPDRRRRRGAWEGARKLGHRDARRSRRRSPTARSATVRTASTAASACRAAR